MIKLLTIAPYKFLPAHNGGQKAIFLLYKYIAKKVFLTVASNKGNKTEYANFAVYKIFSNSPLRYLSINNYFRLKKIVKRREITHVSIEHPYMGLYGILLKERCQLKFVVRSHNIEAERFRTLKKWWWPFLYRYEKFVHKKADHSFFITEEDRQFAIKHFKLKEERTTVLTYGTEIYKALSEQEKRNLVNALKIEYSIPESATLLLFNGSFDYEPNIEALDLLLKRIMPQLLLKDPNFYLLVCGKNIPHSIMNNTFENVKVLGFVDDIHAVFKGSEIFLNPIWLGGGIKTKLVEALGYGCAAVSFKNGAIGIPDGIVDEKISVVDNTDVNAFVDEIIKQRSSVYKIVPHKFYFQFGWENIAQRFVDKINVID